jgi:ATP-dependent DNA helicase DinG
MDYFFAPPYGRIFSCFPNAEVRIGQRRMAELIADSIQEGIERAEAWKLINLGNEGIRKQDAVLQAIEAGTGTGKSLGYLIPALSSNHYPIVIATRTKQLQRQLVDDDLPRVNGIIGRSIKVVLVKGRSNYLCKMAWKNLKSTFLAKISAVDRDLLHMLTAWTKETRTGDREELGRHGEGDSELWERISARIERCNGRYCPYFGECHLTRLRQELLDADLVVTNHALLLANQGLPDSALSQLLPSAPVLILDEAHEIEEQLTDSCAEQWSSHAMTTLFYDMFEELAKDVETLGLDNLLSEWQELWEELLSCIPNINGLFSLDDDRIPVISLQKAFKKWLAIGQTVLAKAKELASRRMGDKLDNLGWRKLLDRITSACSCMEHVFVGSDGWVSTITIEGPQVVLFKVNPVDVRPFFHKYIRQRFEAVILTSATLRDGQGFNSLKMRLGLSDDEVRRSQHVESPFDFRTQGLLFVPPGIPARRSGRDMVGDLAWIEASILAMDRLIVANRGRALVLLTSRKMLALFKPRLEAALPGITFFVQGSGMTRATILERFRKTPNAVILGLASFWHGVDMPGESLSLVIIAALPFAPPDGPVLQARIKEAEAECRGLGFISIQLPQMIIRLKQGMGRLIRTCNDRGAICILDPRVMLPHEDFNGKAYASRIRAALPPFPLSRDWEEVESFLKHS